MVEKTEHVLIFPFMAQGHIIPFLALALQIEKRKRYTITFINTPLNIRKLRSSLPPTSTIRLRAIPFNSSDHGLPPNTENTDNLPYNLIFRLLEVSPSLKPAFRQLVSEIVQEGQEDGSHNPPLCVIVDMFFGWTAEVAHEFHISHAIFATTSGFGMACYYSLWTSMPTWKVQGAADFEMEDFPEGGRIHFTQLPASMADADGTDPWSVYESKRMPEWLNSDGVLFNNVQKLDKVGLAYFNRKLQKPVWTIGPILLKTGSCDQANGGKELGAPTTKEECREWLDTKTPRSVLYVCFGSQNTLTQSQMMELAMALDDSGKSFMWVVRPPVGVDHNSEFKAEEWLPEGFERKVREQNRGLLIRRWAPQLEILSHESVGGFISHCGWNSILEGISRGVPILGWPMAGEQFFNVKLLEAELGICVEIGRGNRCEVKREDLVRKIERVMGKNEEAMEIRRRANQVREIIEDASRDEDDYKGSSIKAIDEFFKAAILRREKTQ
ncbi:hypothetical protein Ancab_000116 [Ancistrocladus abbreviatus]